MQRTAVKGLKTMRRSEDELYEEAENSSDYVDPKEYIPQKRIKKKTCKTGKQKNAVSSGRGAPG